MQELALMWLVLGQFVLMTILFLFFDRYALVLLPASISLVMFRSRIVHPMPAIASLAILAVIAFGGVRDHLEYNATLWRAVNELRSAGVPAMEINGGYSINGWLQYAHPKNARIDENGYVQVPWVNSSESIPSRYMVSNAPHTDYEIVGEFPYRRWIGRSGSIYLLERTADSDWQTEEH